MAAVLGGRKIGLKAKAFTPQLFKIVPVAQARWLSDKSSEPSQKPTDKTVQQEPSAPYKVPEYYSYDIDTFADMEIEMAKYRQSQPDPRVPYYHNYPWEKNSS